MSSPSSIARRGFLSGLAALGAGLGAVSLFRPSRATPVAVGGTPASVLVVDFAPDGRRLNAEKVAKVVKDEDAWRSQLDHTAFVVTRKEGTEYPYTGAYVNNHERGIYRCICCDTALFDSATKFESGTGWPSFWQPIAHENVVETSDRSLGMVRTAVSCVRCDAHLGHVFDDGPKPTGLRYCMNSVALHFVKSA